MAAPTQDNVLKSIFSLSDAWFVISEYMTYHDIGSLSIVNKEANALINQSPVWEQQYRRFFNTPFAIDNNDDNNRFKSHFKHLIELYGHDSIKYYKRVITCWNELNKWCKSNLPKMLTTFNKKASEKELNSLKRLICDCDMLRNNNYQHLTAYLIFLGECCNGQNRKYGRMGLYGYYSFYNKSSSGHLLSISDAIKYTEQVYNVYGANDDERLSSLWLFCAGIPRMDQMITIPCLTFIDKTDGKICKVTQDSQVIYLKHCNSNSFIQHLEFYILNNLLMNNYRVNPEYGILRFPISDLATSSCITKGILCRASPLFVAEISNMKHKNYIFPYHIEIECPTNYYDLDKDIEMKQRCKQCPHFKDEYQLTIRKWFIKDHNEIERINGPGVIGLYPKVFINQELFQYESCSQQNQPSNGEMWGYFVFKQNNGNDDNNKQGFELELKPYKLDWNMCQWI